MADHDSDAVATAHPEHYRAVLGSIEATIFGLDRDGRTTLSEGGALAPLGLRPGERVGQSFLELYANRPEILDAFHRALAGEATTLVVALGDLTFETRLAPLRDRAGVVAGVAGLSLDITERTRAAAKSERTIRQQREAIRELSTPILQVRDRLLLLPIVGTIDADRAQQLTEQLLRAIRTNRGKVVVIDVTGVPVVDTTVANHLVQAAEASRLLGARMILTGLSSEVARTLVTLGADLGTLETMSDLQQGLEAAERLLGYEASL